MTLFNWSYFGSLLPDSVAYLARLLGYVQIKYVITN